MAYYNEPTPEQIAEEKIYRQMAVSDDEFALIQKLLGRLPNYTELGLFSVMWSEHCSYKNSKPVIKKFPTTGPQVLQGPGEGAGIVDIGDGLGIAFKIESHNHPSAVEPYQGAATGVGGILRDVFSMGARPIALLNSLRFGELANDRMKYLFKGVVAGIAGYGNRMGIPTVGGEIYFDSSYEGNPLVNAMCVGLIRHDQIQRGIAKGVGNSVVYVGAATGRDGIHGATFASVEFGDEAAVELPAVQAGDPFVEKLLMEACLELIEKDVLLGIQDMGAAGLTSSSAEMASKAGNGIELNLDLVPQRDPNMSAYEMMLSESQERMLLVVEKGREQEVEAICQKWGLTAVTIGRVTDDGRMRLLHKGQVVADVPVDYLAEKAPVYHQPSREPASFRENQAKLVEDLSINNGTETLKQLLAMPSIASKEWVFQQFDYLSGNNTIVRPGSDAAIIRIPETNKAIGITTDCNAGYIYLDPYTGGAIAVAEAARNLVCSGAKPLAITDGLNFGSPENPEVFWQIEQAAIGISEACLKFGTPVVSGNVSLYNETNGNAIYPTPIIGMVGVIEKLDHITTQHVKTAGDVVVLLGRTVPGLGGSQLQKLIDGEISGKLPDFDLAYEARVQKLVLAAIQQGLLASAHDLSEGGLAVALAEIVMETPFGLELNLNSSLPTSVILFGEAQSRVVVSLNEEKLAALKQLAATYDVELAVIGQVNNSGNYILRLNGEEIIATSVVELEKTWKGAIPCMIND